MNTSRNILRKKNLIFKETIYEGYYASKCGKIYSIRKDIILSACRLSNGYVHLGVRVDKKSKTVKVHRLVAEVWCENPDNKPFVNHKDGIKHNNHASNLEWVTRSENTKHAYDNGLQPNNCIGEKNPKSKLTKDQVLEIREAKGLQREIAKKYGVTASTIQKIKSRIIWSHI